MNAQHSITVQVALCERINEMFATLGLMLCVEFDASLHVVQDASRFRQHETELNSLSLLDDTLQYLNF